ncbi:MAG TPA: apolipoprotein N-acyltransferase, partial [Armatimonadota bacterium]|nr:apolipoprotein N-acyltransferase [Armatimonadota bacterium]
MQNAALAVVSGVLMVLAFPKFGLFPLAWISLIPLIVAVNRARWLGSFGLGVITGFVFFGGLLYWISLFGYL